MTYGVRRDKTLMSYFLTDLNLFMAPEFQPSPEQVKAARSLLSWTQQELASRARVALSTVADFERGQRSPVPNNALAIRQALERSGVVFTQGGVSHGFAWTFKTETRTATLHATFEPASAASVIEFASIFGTAEAGKVAIAGIQCATPELKAAVVSHVGKHGASNKQLNALQKLVTDLRDGEFFLLLPEQPISSAAEYQMGMLLQKLNHPEEQSFEAEQQQMFGILLENYDICAPRTDVRNEIGNAERASRTCRFCHRTKANGATFKKKAHALPASLGNQFLKLRDECDDCNGYFGEDLEPALVELLNIQRVFLGIESRGARPTIEFAGGSMRHEGALVVVVPTQISQDASGAITAQVGSQQRFVPQNVYRALAKIALSVIPEEHLSSLDRTVRWVRYGEGSEDELPTVAVALVDLPPDPSAQITLYIRRTDNLRTPHIVCEFRIGCYLYAYALPFSSRDNQSLKGFFQDAAFKDTFRHYARVPSWKEQDFSSTKKFTLAHSIRLSAT